MRAVQGSRSTALALARFCLGVVLFVVTAVVAVTADDRPASATTSQLRIGVPTYFYPLWWNSPNDWYRMCDGAQSNGVPLAMIINLANGPGGAQNSDYVSATGYCKARGASILGYVDTDYSARSSALVTADIDAWYSWYSMDGIFFDRMSNDVATVSYYSTIYAHVKGAGSVGHDLVVGNPGVDATTDWQLSTPVADQINIFEGTVNTYVGWTPQSWVQGYSADHFWNIVYDADDVGQLAAAMGHRNAVNADTIFVTPGVMPNPFNFLPDDTYWAAELSQEQPTVSAVVDPTLAVTVNGYNAGSCNGTAVNATSSTATAVPLGHLALGGTKVGGQTIAVVSNAAGGHAIYIRSTGPLTSDNGPTIADWTGTNASPTTFPSSGTAAFGYTTDHGLSGGSTRFQSDEWAGLTGANEEVAVQPAGDGTADTTHVCFRAGIAGTTVAGAYATTVMYTVVPSF